MIARASMLAVAVLAASPSLAAQRPGWKAFAGCAAAYRANAQLADPDRPKSMTAMISETADEYQTAARDRYRAQTKAPADAAASAVEAYVRKQTDVYRRKSRTDVEHVIDACPQTDEGASG